MILIYTYLPFVQITLKGMSFNENSTQPDIQLFTVLYRNSSVLVRCKGLIVNKVKLKPSCKFTNLQYELYLYSWLEVKQYFRQCLKLVYVI